MKKLSFFFALILATSAYATDNSKKPTHGQADNSRIHIQKMEPTPSKTLSIPKLRRVKLTPKVRAEFLDDYTLTIPLTTIKPFIAHLKVIEKDALEHAPKIIANDEDRVIVALGDKIFVKGIHDPTVKNYDIFRPGITYVDPKTKEVLGYEAVQLGHAELLRITNPAVMQVTGSTQEILTGDRLIPQNDDFVQTEYKVHSPRHHVDSTIVSVFGGVDLVGQYNVIVIKGGSQTGMQVGDLLGIYRDRIAFPNISERDKSIDLPEEMAGEAMVFRTFNTLSLALVLDAKKTLYVGDKISNL